MSRIIFALLLGMLSATCAWGDDEPPGVVIVNARVIDGSGGPSRNVTVRITG